MKTYKCDGGVEQGYHDGQATCHTDEYRGYDHNGRGNHGRNRMSAHVREVGGGVVGVVVVVVAVGRFEVASAEHAKMRPTPIESNINTKQAVFSVALQSGSS